ncbi:MAG TPA: hypothetical protein VGF95_13705 [Solirubrobacteraceae bacterium]|jgi:hypothetical protein
MRLRNVKSCVAIVAAICVPCALVPAAGASPAGGAATSAGGVTATTAAATLPPGLVALEQQMQQLPLTSDRFSMKIDLGDSGIGSEEAGFFELLSKAEKGHHRHKSSGKAPLPREGGSTRVRGVDSTAREIPLIAGTGERSLPAEQGAQEVSVLKAKLLGALPMEVRTVDGQGYLRESGIARVDGGLPWVHVSQAEISAEDEAFATPTGAGEGGSSGLFEQVPKDLEVATEVSEAGPATVDGKQTTEYTAKLDMGKLTKGLTVDETPEVRKQLAKAKGVLDVYFEPNGLPLRTIFTIGLGHVSMIAKVDILATDVPIEVSAPPASETIAAAKLKEIEKRKAAKQLKALHKQGEHEQRKG